MPGPMPEPANHPTRRSASATSGLIPMAEPSSAVTNSQNFFPQQGSCEAMRRMDVRHPTILCACMAAANLLGEEAAGAQTACACASGVAGVEGCVAESGAMTLATGAALILSAALLQCGILLVTQ